MASLVGFPEPIKSGTSEDGSSSYVWKGPRGKLLRLRVPLGGQGSVLNVFEKPDSVSEPISVQEFHGSLDFLRDMLSMLLR